MTDHVIKLSDLSAEGILALRKCEAAERFTSVPGNVRNEVYLVFQESGLIKWRNGQRLTDAGRKLLDQWNVRHVDNEPGQRKPRTRRR